jgi:hypothetical protein
LNSSTSASVRSIIGSVILLSPRVGRQAHTEYERMREGVKGDGVANTPPAKPVCSSQKQRGPGQGASRHRSGSAISYRGRITGTDTFMRAQLAPSLFPVERFVGQFVGELFNFGFSLFAHWFDHLALPQGRNRPARNMSERPRLRGLSSSLWLSGSRRSSSNQHGTFCPLPVPGRALRRTARR